MDMDAHARARTHTHTHTHTRQAGWTCRTGTFSAAAAGAAGEPLYLYYIILYYIIFMRFIGAEGEPLKCKCSTM